MSAHAKKYLNINGDDFGSSEASNRGIIRAYRDGILRSAALMAPCPWFAQAIELAKEHKLPCSVHLTLTCEYDRYLFGPLTHAKELTRDGKGHAFFKDPNQLPKDAQDVVYRELEAQIERFFDFGLTPSFLDAHMGVVPRWDNAFLPVAERLYEKFKIPFLRLGKWDELYGPKDLKIDLLSGLGQGPKELTFKQRVRAQIKALKPGFTYLICHAAEMSPEMKGMELHDGFAYARQVDLETLLDPEVREWIREFDVTLGFPT